MHRNHIRMPRPLTTYLAAWLIYIAFAVLAFPVFSVSVMLFSVALAMLGAWFYGYAGAIITTALTIPYHYLFLSYYTNDPAILNEAFNPFGISTQLIASGAIALLRHTKRKLQELTMILEQKVEERTRELSHLQHYIIQNHETAQILLSHMLLGDIGDSLSEMLNKSDRLLRELAFDDKPASHQVTRLNNMIKGSIDLIENLEFVDHFFSDQEAGFSNAIQDIMDHFKTTAGIDFDLRLHINHEQIPKYIQHQLYRITQEAITNAVKHGKASKIAIDLRIDQGSYRLSVANDGEPLPSRIVSGLGLKLMQQRTQQLGGSLGWQKTRDGKTLFDCRIPIMSG